MSIIVPAYNVERWLSATLASITGQPHSNLEIIIVNDGSTDRTQSVAKVWSFFDRRITVVSQENQELGAARNAGVKHATGKCITFADSDDVLCADGISSMVASLEASGSDFAVGRIMRRSRGKIWTPEWARKAHIADRHGTTLEESPDILPDVFAHNKMWRREFFDSVVGGFPTNILYEDQEPALRSYLSAASFDILAAPVYIWEVRADGTSLSQKKARLEDLKDRLEVCRRLTEAVEGASPTVRDAFYAKLFQYDLFSYIEQTPRVGPEYFGILCEAVKAFVDKAGSGFWAHIPVYYRMLTYYAARSDYDAIMLVLADRAERGRGGVLTASRDGFAYEKPAYAQELPPAPPEELWEIALTNLDVAATLESVSWTDETRVELGLYAYAHSIFDTGEEVPLQFALVDQQTGAVCPLEAERFTDPRFGERSALARHDASACGHRLTVDVAQLEFSGESRWMLSVAVATSDAPRYHPVVSVGSDRAASRLGFSAWDGSRTVVLKSITGAGVGFVRANPLCLADEITLSGRRLGMTVESLEGRKIASLELSNRVGVKLHRCTPTHSSAGRVRFELTVPPLPGRSRAPLSATWQLKVRFADGRTARVLAAEGHRALGSPPGPGRPA